MKLSRRARVGIGLLVVVLGAAVYWFATADVSNIVDSYAYVSSVEYDSEPAQSTASHRCNVVALVPDATVTTRPADSDRALLAAGSRKIHRRVVDSFGNCKDFIHTWQPVWFTTADRDNLHLDWPAGSPGFFGHAMYLAMLGGLAWALVVYVRKKLAARRALPPKAQARVTRSGH